MASNIKVTFRGDTPLKVGIPGTAFTGGMSIGGIIAGSTAGKILVVGTGGVLAEVDPETGSTIRAKLGITTLSGSNTGDQDLSGLQVALVSGTNIKTINSTSLLGSGDIAITGMSIGGTIGNSPLVSRMLFVGSGGVLAQDTDFTYAATTNRLRLYGGRISLIGANTSSQLTFSPETSNNNTNNHFISFYNTYSEEGYETGRISSGSQNQLGYAINLSVGTQGVQKLAVIVTSLANVDVAYSSLSTDSINPQFVVFSGDATQATGKFIRLKHDQTNGIIGDGNNNAILIGSTGNVGFTHTIPTARVHVKAASADGSSYVFKGDDSAGATHFSVTDQGATIINIPTGYAGDAFKLQLNGSTKFSINQSGGIGIGNGGVAPYGTGTTLALGNVSWAVGGIGVKLFGVNFTNITGNAIPCNLAVTYNQASGSGSNTDFLISRTETLINTGKQLLIDAQVNTVSKFSVDHDGKIVSAANRLQLSTAKTPINATDTGEQGEICWDANYLYICTATNTWKRAAIATW
ncbi:MAG: hypothetical protein WCK32_00775 [Chlorobiaceae bacterium]